MNKSWNKINTTCGLENWDTVFAYFLLKQSFFPSKWSMNLEKITVRHHGKCGVSFMKEAFYISFSSLDSKPSRKIGAAKRRLLEHSWLIYRLRSKLYFFRNKTFLFFKIESWNFQHAVWNSISWNLTKFQLIQLIQTIFISIFSIPCLIELKFWEISRICFFNIC